MELTESGKKLQKSFYSLLDFNELKPFAEQIQQASLKGNSWVNPLAAAFRSKEITLTCPKCGKHHLSLNRDTGVYHCWTCNEMNGQLEEFRQHQSQLIRHKAPKSKNEVPMADTDYKSVNPELLQHTWGVFEPTSVLNEKPVYNTTQIQAQKYLQSIGISAATAEMVALRCGMFSVAVEGARGKELQSLPCLVYANRLYGQIVNLKMRTVRRNDKGDYLKAWTQETPTTPAAPYNIDCLNPIAPYRGQGNFLIITEGEKDVLTLLECGFDKVISVPNGAQSDIAGSFEAFYEWIHDAGPVLICGDNDHPGRELVQRLEKYFRHRAASVTLPRGCKDISEVYATYGREEVVRLLSTVEWRSHPDILQLHSFTENYLQVLNGDFDKGYSLGYGPVTDLHFRLTTEGGLIVVTGRPNSGKTDWMRCTLARLMLLQQKRVASLSFEEPNKALQIRRYVELAFAERHTEQIPRETQLKFLERLDGLFVHLQTTSCRSTPKNIIGLCEQLQQDYAFPLDFLYVDPYLFLENDFHQETETQQIKAVLTQFQEWGRKQHVWVIIVAHPRKLVKDGAGEYEDVDEYSISGSAHWANLADFLLSVKRVFPAGNTDEGSNAPSFTEVNMLKVRDQTICHTGKMYYLRQPNGRYEERPDEATCREELTHPYVAFKEREVWL